MKLRDLWKYLYEPPISGPPVTLVVRLMAGAVFFWEGLLKFVYVNQGVGRFTKLGFALPDVIAPAVGALEIGGGVLVMAGFLTRFITIAFVVEMLVAMLSTKISLYLGTSPLPAPPSPPKVGIWAVLHEVRSEYAQLMSCVFLFVAGPGLWSIDAWFANKSKQRSRPHATVLPDRATT